MTIKQSLENWEEYLKAITDSTFIDTEETDEARARRVAALEADPEQWFCYYFPRYTFAPPADFHLSATERVLNNPEHYEVRLWSRELAKSTRTMMEVFYLMLVGHPPQEQRPERLLKKYCLIISNSFDNATRLLAPYKMNLESNHRIIQDYGPQQNAGKWQAAEFTTEKGLSFRALGAGQSPRGTRNEEARPDILIFDDVDTDADCLNPEIIAKKWRWIEEAAIGTRSVSQPTTILFCGNMIAVDCCIVRAMPFADCTDQQNIRNKDGKSNWHQKNSEEDIDRVLRQKSYAAREKEYFNNPIVEGAVFKEMYWKPVLPIKDYEALVCYTDPSFSDSGDFKAMVLVGKWQEEYHVIKAFVEQTTTADLFTWHREMVKVAEGNPRCRFYVERVFMQDVLIQQMNDTCKKTGFPIFLQGDDRKKGHKYTRIETALEPLNRNGQLYLNAAEEHNPHMVRLVGQFKAFAHGSHAHDDAPDAVEGALWLLREWYTLNQNPMATFGKKLENKKM